MVLSLLFFKLVSGYRYLDDGDTDRREILHGGTYWSQTGPPILGAVPQAEPLQFQILGLNFGHLTANISKTVSRSVTRQLELNISSTRAF